MRHARVALLVMLVLAILLAPLDSTAQSPEKVRSGLVWNEMQAPALALGLTLRRVEVRGQGDVERALTATTRARDDALFVAHDLVLFDARKRINDFALKHRLPTSFALREYVADGGLMSYGVSFADLWRRMGYVVDKLLRGARPADLPIEQPTKFELVINARTAKALGLTIPSSILLRTDQVIE
jgi:putative ABC transport system substrate-binding protein